VQEEDTNIIDSSASAAVDVSPEADSSDASTTDDKSTKTLKLNRVETQKKMRLLPNNRKSRSIRVILRPHQRAKTVKIRVGDATDATATGVTAVNRTSRQKIH
jgi:hypothetical protein